MKRCFWAEGKAPYYQDYHDLEWGVPVHDDRQHFEMLVLEGAQAGLNWDAVLKKREAYRRLFHNFDPQRVARMEEEELANIQINPGVIRNRLKIFSARKNAVAFLNIQKEFKSFDAYVWTFVGGQPKVNRPQGREDILVSTPESIALSTDLRRRGMTFVGPVITYAYMQAVGIVNDHTSECFRCQA